MSVYSLFDIGRNALIAMRTALDVTAHNVANAATPGYHRQEVIFEDIPEGVLISRTSTGRGVRVADVRRLYDDFLAQQLRLEEGNEAYWDVFNSYFPKIESVMNDESGAGLAGPLNDFFSAWDEVAQHPEEFAQRELLLKSGAYFAERIGSAYSSLRDLEEGLFDEAVATVDEINQMLYQISDLNRKIALAPGVIDLKDQRDALLDKLNSLVRINSFEESNGKVTILLGGTPLLEGELVHELTVSHGAEGEVKVTALVSGVTKDVSSFVSGGKLKALMDLRDTTLKEYMDKLTVFAVNLTQEVNARHREGIDLNGDEGLDFFSSPVEVLDPASGGFVSSVKVSDSTALSYHRFRVDYTHSPPEDSADFTVTDLNTGSVVPVTVSIDKDTMKRVVYFSGIEMTIEGPLTADESFEVQVKKDAVMEVGVALSEAEQVAASSPVYEITGANDTIVIDDGTVKYLTLPHGVYDGEALASLLEENLESVVGTGADFEVYYNRQLKMFHIMSSPGNSVTVDFLWEDGNSTAREMFGFSSDTPPVTPGGDLVSQFGTGGSAISGLPGNNGNAQNISSIQDDPVIAGETPGGYYRELVSQVGLDARSSETMYAFQSSVVEGLRLKMEEISGVNLDEEAANLIRFQKSFEAAAKMITVADDLLSTLLNMVGS